ncbi:MAG: hypothetical protein HY298_21005 [Verrucomicrobia bacterium]|nr:hypothetical protein [Verrucomicrobiota bacterium]
MRTRPRLVILNPTCLEVVDEFRSWIKSLDVDLVAEESFRLLRDDQIGRVLEGAHGLILPAAIRQLPVAKQMQDNPGLQVLSIAASGYEWLDVDAATRNGIVVTHAAGNGGAEVVADYAFGLMLSVARQISHHDQLLRLGKSQRGMGTSLWGKTLGVVGLGHIGRATVRRALGFSMKLLVTTPRPDMDFVRQHHIELVPLDELLRRSDFVSLHVRLNGETKEVIGARELGLMKSTAYLINTARQQLVDETALTRALLEHRIAGAAIDDPPLIPDSPLLQLPNFVCTPHLGNRAIDGVHAVFELAIENAVAVLKGWRPHLAINPDVYNGSMRAPRPLGDSATVVCRT